MTDLAAIIKSIIIYYNPLKIIKLRRLYGSFISPGSLCFDIGAHVGNRTLVMSSLRAGVIALEPQNSCSKLMKLLFGLNPRVKVLSYAAGAVSETGTLKLSPGNPTLATVSDEWIKTVSNADSFSGIRWTRSAGINITTLDDLIDLYGIPDFIKIDVEGYEYKVLLGLSKAIPALSFEFMPAGIGVALACLDILENMARYVYNISFGERLTFRFSSWLDIGTLRSFLLRLSPTGKSGDIYARIVP